VKSISKSQAQALADGLLNSLGNKGGFTPVKDLELTTVGKMLAEGAEVFILNAQENLDKKRSTSTGELHDSIMFQIVPDGNLVWNLDVGYLEGSEGAKYFQFVDEGVGGTESSKGHTGKFNFKTPYANQKMAKALMAWLRLNSAKVQSRDASKRAYKGIERKGKRLNQLVKKNDLKSLSYAIATNIKKRGIKKTQYFTNATKQSFNKPFIDALAIALATDVRIFIRKSASK
jgi:hypothetical protein